MAAGGAGRELTITFHGSGMVDGKCVGRATPGKPACTGTSIVDVPLGTPIAAIVAAKKDDLKPSLAIVAGVASDDEGHNFVTSATVEKNGVKPEF